MRRLGYKKSEIEKKDGYTIYRNYGTRKKLQEIFEEAKSAYNACLENDQKFLLSDHRHVNYDIQFSDAFNLIRVFEFNFSRLHEIEIAHVTSNQNTELVNFWKTLCEQRGYKIKLFTDLEEGECWIQNQLTKKQA